MPRRKEATRKDESNKRPNTNSQKGNSQEPPPPKKAKPNPPQSASTNNTTEPTSAPRSAAPQPTETLATASTLLNPPDLTLTHDHTTLSIISSTSIQKKVTHILEILSVYPVPQNEKPKVVMMRAKAGVASKMISIAEIAKREIGKDGRKWFQYTCVEGVMGKVKETIKKEKGKAAGEDKLAVDGDGVAEDEESEEETTAFETMKTPFERANEGKAKLRAVPVMSLYLSRIRVESLRKVYGEQTNALQAT